MASMWVALVVLRCSVVALVVVLVRCDCCVMLLVDVVGRIG